MNAVASMGDLFVSFHLLRPWWLILLVPALILWWLARRAGDSTGRWRRAIDPALLAHLVVGPARRRVIVPADVLLAGWIIGLVALGGPTWRQVPSPLAEATRPAMVVLKVTPSMQTGDLAPSRLDRARQKLADLLDARAGGATGLIAYAGSAHLVLPPTADRDVILAMAKALSPDIMPRDGDALGKAVALAANILDDAHLGGAILIVADTVAPDQVAALKPPAGQPVTVLGMAPAEALDHDPAITDAVRALHATLVATTVDSADVTAVARHLATGGAPAGRAGQRWEEAGYWLTPILALIALLWFRRGWVLA